MVLGGDNRTERERLKKAIASSEAQRATLGDTVVGTLARKTGRRGAGRSS